MKFLSDKKNFYFTGMYLSLLAFMICSAADWGIGVALFKILTILLFVLFLFKENSKKNMTDFEKSVMVLVVLLFNIFMLQRGKMQGQYEVLNTICSCVLIVMGIAYFAFYHNGISVKKWFAENKIIILVIVCFILLSIEVIKIWPMWDAWQYYIALVSVVKNFNADFTGIYGIRMCGHACEGYSLWLILFQLFREGTASVQIADIVLAVISIYAYYQILRKILGKKHSNAILALATVPYAFSPFVMGIVGNSNLDSATMYFAIIFIACSLYHYECLELIFAGIFCFTKEPALVYYVAYIIIKVICDYLSENRFHLWKLIKFGFGNIKNYIYAMPTIFWMVLYKLNQGGGWANGTSQTWNDSGFNCFGISIEAISMKLKHIFFLNFNWLFWIAIILGIIFLRIKKVKIEKEIYKMIIPIGALGIALIVFECAYITYILPRYIVPVIPVIYLIATTVLGNLKNKLFYIWNVLMSVLLVIQCFYAMDPVMGSIFPSRPMGDDEHYVIYETGNVNRFDDHITYNRQNVHWTETITKVLEQAEYNANMLIVFPTRTTNSQNEMLGNRGCVWNTQTRKMEFDKTQGCVSVSVCNVANVEKTIESMEGNRILYIIPKWDEVDNNFISDNARASKNIIRQGKVNNKGYTVQYFVMDIQYKFPLEDGYYTISPKQESSLKLCTDGHEQRPYLKTEAEALKLSAAKTRYELIFENAQVALDVPNGSVNSEGNIWTYRINHTISQKWSLEEVNGYYMISWGDYALTYDLDNNSVRLKPKTGSDNQLWSFTVRALDREE